MAPRKILLAVFLGACSALTAASPVQAAQSSPRCDDMLIDLGSMQAALDQMEKAVAANDTHQQDLRTEASTLAATIAERLRGGATLLALGAVFRQHGFEPVRDQLDVFLAAWRCEWR